MTSVRSPIRLLHVDDDPAFLDLVTAFFDTDDRPFTVETTTDAAAVLSRLGDDEYDAIVSDYEMPEMDGIELLETVREIHPDIPFVLFTGKGSEEVASEAIAAGVSDYVQKGSTDKLQLLANRVRNLVGQYRAQRDLEGYATQQRIVANLGQTALDEELQPLVDAAAERVCEGLDVEFCKILETQEDGDLRLRAGTGWEGVTADETVVEGGANSQAGYTLDRDDTVIVTDLESDDRFEGPPLLVDHGVVSGISVLIGPSETPWGVLGAHTTTRRAFTDDDVTFVESVASILGSAIERHQYRTTIEQQADLFEKTQEIANVGAWEWNVETGEAVSTPRVGRIFGFDDAATTPPSFEDAIERFHPDDRSKMTAAFERATELGESYDLELRIIRPDGKQRWVHTRGEPQSVDGELVRVRGTIQDITERKTSELELAETVDALKRVCRTATNASLSFETKLERVLKLGREMTGLPYGFLTAIERGGAEGAGEGIQRIVHAVGEHDLLQTGSSCPLEEAYCRKTIETDQVLAIHDAVEAGWEDDPAYETFELGSYIGTKVYVDDELYGTFCFASSEPRDEPFSEAAKVVVQMMGQWAGYELERGRAHAIETRSDDRLSELTSVLSHDLRNPLSIAKGRTELARAEADSEHLDAALSAIERVERLVEELLRLAQTEEVELQSVSVADMATEAWKTIQSDEAELVVETDRSVWADPARCRQMFRNLFQNAVEHGGRGVTVTVGDLVDGDGFYVADDGVGLPEEDKDVFELGYSTSEDGLGFGLSIVERVADLHGWRVRVTESESGGVRLETRVLERPDG